MGIKTKKMGEAKNKAAARTEGKATQASLRVDELRQKALGAFHPSVLDWFKENLNLDLSSNQVSVADVYRLSRGEFTSPVRIVVTPQVYDRSKKQNIDMPRLQAMVSLRGSFPVEKGAPLALDDNHKVFLQTVPCRPLAELASSGEEVASQSAQKADDREAKFTENQLMALEGIGIARERLYGGFNRLSRQEKLDILDGEIFPVEGSVKTSFGIVNVIGEARMTTDEESGDVKMIFEPTYPEKRSEGLVIDLDRARIIGALELDFYQRNADGSRKVDVDGLPVLNEAGRNILDYGASGGPVTGYLHTRERDKDGTWKEKVSAREYTVRAINGSLFATVLSEKEENGVKVSEVPNARINKDGKVYVSGETKPLSFSSDSDRDSALRGGFGVVQGASYKDFKTGKTVTYDAVVYFNEAGFAEKFSPATSEKIKKSLKRPESVSKKASAKEQTVIRPSTARRKVKFGQGL